MLRKIRGVLILKNRCETRRTQLKVAYLTSNPRLDMPHALLLPVSANCLPENVVHSSWCLYRHRARGTLNPRPCVVAPPSICIYIYIHIHMYIYICIYKLGS